MKSIFYKKGFLLLTIAIFLLGGFFVFNTARADSALITQIKFTTTPQTINMNTVSAVLTTQTQKVVETIDTSEQVSETTTLNLNSTSGTGQFSSNAETWIPVTTLTMNTGSANRSFYYRDSTPGTHTLTVTAEGKNWTAATQNVVVTPLEVGAGKQYTTIQSAIDAANVGDIISVYPGNYNQDEANGYDPVTGEAGASDFNIFVNKSVTIQGVDASGNPITNVNDVEAFVVPKRDTPLGNLSTIFVQADNVTISGLDIVAYADSDFNFKTISVIGDNVTIKNSALHAGDQVSSIYMYDPRYDAGTDTSHIQSYRFENNSLDAGGIYASGIRISSGPGWSGDSANRIISGNTISSGSYGIEFVGPGGDAWDVYPVGAATIATNNFSGQAKGSVVAWGKYNDVEGYGNINWDAIYSGNTFDKAVIVKTPLNAVRSYDYLGGPTFYFIRGIYSAIQRYPINQVAQSGDTINVASGTYAESVLVNKSLTIIGTGLTKPVIIGLALTNYIVKIDTTTNVILDNLEIDGGGTTRGDNVFDYGIWVNNSGTIENSVEIKNSEIKNVWNTSSNGIEIDSDTVGGSYVLIHDSIISAFDKRGVRFIKSNGKVYNSEIIGQNVDGISRVQNLINLWGGSNVEIYGNKLHNALTTGTTPAWDSVGVLVTSYNNNINSYANIHDNEIYSNDSGVIIGSYYATTDSSSADITNNDFHDLNQAINFEKSTASAVVHENQFSNNAKAMNAEDGDGPVILNSTIDAENNWWGTTDYTTVNSKISGNVTFRPYCSTSACTGNYFYPLTVSGITASSKVYDGDSSAVLDTSLAVLNGVIAGDSVTLNVAGAVGTFIDKNIGTGKVVNISQLTVMGDNAAEYSLTQPTTTADIEPTESQVVPDNTGVATVNSATPEVVITDPDLNVVITVETSNATLNLTALVSGGTGVLPEITINAGSATVVIPDNTTVTSTDWDGIMSAPTTGSSSGTAPAGFSVGNTVVEMGSPDHTLTFSNAVKIVLTGVTGTVGYKPAGSSTWQTITTQCNSASDSSNITSGECYFTDGSDTVIWTYHFTSFGGLNVVRSGGGGGGGIINLPQTPTISSVSITPVAQVLGASTEKIPGCGNRTTGFSVVSGQSCATNSVGQVLGAEKFVFTKLMKRGSRGDEVKELQNFLIAAGYNPGIADGIFGNKSKAALIKFQLANGLKGDGIAGPKVRALLNK
jgi:hypothetical protein